MEMGSVWKILVLFSIFKISILISWCKVMKDAGNEKKSSLRPIHHDAFCFANSSYTKHGWCLHHTKNGWGRCLKELSRNLVRNMILKWGFTFPPADLLQLKLQKDLYCKRVVITPKNVPYLESKKADLRTKNHFWVRSGRLQWIIFVKSNVWIN